MQNEEKAGIRFLSKKELVCRSLCERDEDDIQSFTISRESGKGLERYLKLFAYKDEEDGLVRTYIIRHADTDEIAGYFSLRALAVAIKNTVFSHDMASGVELMNFAVNDAYRIRHPENPHPGERIFYDFVVPMIREAAKIIGAQNIYIFALPEENLIKYYKEYGFRRIEAKEEFWINHRIKPEYDTRCVFMCLPLRKVEAEKEKRDKKKQAKE